MQIGNTLKYMSANEVNKDKREFNVIEFKDFRECVSVLVLLLKQGDRIKVIFEEMSDDRP